MLLVLAEQPRPCVLAAQEFRRVAPLLGSSAFQAEKRSRHPLRSPAGRTTRQLCSLPIRNHSCPEAGTGPRWRWGSPCYPRGGLRAPQSAPTALPAEPTSSSPPEDGNVGASPTHPASPSPFSLCCALQTQLRPMRRVIGPHRWHGCREITKTGRSKQTPAGGPAPACGTGPHLLSCKPCLEEVGR